MVYFTKQVSGLGSATLLLGTVSWRVKPHHPSTSTAEEIVHTLRKVAMFDTKQYDTSAMQEMDATSGLIRIDEHIVPPRILTYDSDPH